MRAIRIGDVYTRDLLIGIGEGSAVVVVCENQFDIYRCIMHGKFSDGTMSRSIACRADYLRECRLLSEGCIDDG